MGATRASGHDHRKRTKPCKTRRVRDGHYATPMLLAAAERLGAAMRRELDLSIAGAAGHVIRPAHLKEIHPAAERALRHARRRDLIDGDIERQPPASRSGR